MWIGYELGTAQLEQTRDLLESVLNVADSARIFVLEADTVVGCYLGVCR